MGKLITCYNCGLVVSKQENLIDGLCEDCAVAEALENIIEYVDRISKENESKFFNFED